MEFNRCYGCMRELETPGALCPHCGYDNTNDPGRQPSHVLPCGTILNGQYMVGRSLGQGGFGITYIGYDMNLEIPVCIKEYYPEGSAMRSASQSRMVYWGTSENAQGMKESRNSFVKEAQKAVKLRNLSHVVTVWGVFYENETAYIVMDYIEGETLKNRLIRTQKTLGERECIELLTPVMADLEKAHARGIIHRDIKPDNIMLAVDGEPMLLDMGAAKDLGKSAQNGNALSSTLVISQGFSPREQYRQKGNIGPWTDVYAMSATICYCVTGRILPTPMDRDDGEEIDLRSFSPTVAQVLEKGLALKVEDRIQTMGELLAALRAAIEEPGIDWEAERLERERLERERLERERLEGERLEKERLKRDVRSVSAEKASKKKKKRGVVYSIIAAAAVLIIGISVKSSNGKPNSRAITQPTVTAKRTATPIPTPSGKPLSTGETEAGLHYEVFDDCVRISGCDIKITEAVIPDNIKGKPVTSIGNNAFRDCKALKSVTIPDNVINIGNWAFSGCSALTSVTIPASVTSIDSFAFDGCSALTSVTIPASVTSIGNSAFRECKALASMTIPASVTSIGNLAFSGCESLTSVTIPTSVTSIGNWAFDGCSALTSVTIPDSVNSIGVGVFSGCSALKSATIPAGVASIGDSAFADCDALKDVHYSGTKAQWEKIEIGDLNQNLTKATIHYVK